MHINSVGGTILLLLKIDKLPAAGFISGPAVRERISA